MRDAWLKQHHYVFAGLARQRPNAVNDEVQCAEQCTGAFRTNSKLTQIPKVAYAWVIREDQERRRYRLELAHCPSQLKLRRKKLQVTDRHNSYWLKQVHDHCSVRTFADFLHFCLCRIDARDARYRNDTLRKAVADRTSAARGRNAAARACHHVAPNRTYAAV